MGSLLENLSEYAISLTPDNLPKEVIHEVKRRIVDSFGCAYGAYASTPGTIARNMGKAVIQSSPSTIFGTSCNTSCGLATFANGILIRYLDYNDTYLSFEPAHPSDNISAAFAIGETVHAIGIDVICAIVVGYEIQSRLCDAASLRKMGWDHVGYLNISASALSAKLLNLNKDKTMNAISLAIVPNNPLRQTRVGELSMWKGCAAANACRNGVFSAVMASHGMTGPMEVFEGEKGFFNQVTGGPFVCDANLFGGKRGEYKICDTYIKYYPSEYHSQAAIEAALLLRSEVDISDIKEITVLTYDACVDIIAGDEEKWNPKTRETADHSLPYAIAASLYYGTVSMDEFTDEKINNPKVYDLMSRISVHRHDEHTKAYPSSFPCIITIFTNEGKQFSKTVTYPKGHPQNPLTDEEIIAKFNMLSDPYLTKTKQSEVIDRIFNLEKEKDMGKFMKQFKVEKKI